MNYEKTYEIEWAVANWFGTRTHVIVPNVTWGLHFNYELDLAILSSSDYLYEVEIKISKSDLIKDKEKDKWRYHDLVNRIRKLWFAVPEKLKDLIDYIPSKSGFLIVSNIGKVTEIRKPVIDNNAKKLSEKEKFMLARLGVMRIWKLKRNYIIEQHNKYIQKG
jgi:hypothetical protein